MDMGRFGYGYEPNLDGVWVWVDVDDFIRKDKQPLDEELEDTMQACRRTGMHIGFVTGAPFSHVGGLTVVDAIIAESGGVQVFGAGNMSIHRGDAVHNPHDESMKFFAKHLGLVPGKVFQEIPEGTIILEGPRKASITILCEGTPPHFPGLKATARRKDLEARINQDIVDLHICLRAAGGTTHGYSWIDISWPWNTKNHALSRLGGDPSNGCSSCGHGRRKVYYGGDGQSDLEVMQGFSSSMVPLAMQNSIPEIKKIAAERGIYVNKPGPGGGALELFKRFLEDRLVSDPLLL